MRARVMGRQATPSSVPAGPGTLLNQCRLHKTKKHRDTACSTLSLNRPGFFGGECDTPLSRFTGKTSPHRTWLVVSRSTCPPLPPCPHAKSFVRGTAVINTHTWDNKHPNMGQDLLLSHQQPSCRSTPCLLSFCKYRNDKRQGVHNDKRQSVPISASSCSARWGEGLWGPRREGGTLCHRRVKTLPFLKDLLDPPASLTCTTRQ
jgi:hypothetical protein